MMQRSCLACNSFGTVFDPWHSLCPVCEGSGTVDAKASRADALADAESLRGNTVLDGVAVDLYEELINWNYTDARGAARAAFRAVPALRGDGGA